MTPAPKGATSISPADTETDTTTAPDETPASSSPFPEVLRSARRGLSPSEDEGRTPGRGAAFDEPDPFAPTISYIPPLPFDDEPATDTPGLSEPAPTRAPAPPEPVPAPIPGHDEAPSLSATEPDLARLDANYGRPRKATHPLVRVLALLFVLGLSALLAAQTTYLYRMEIARTLPGLRPLLSTACAHLGCDVPYPRDAEHIAIEASDLQAEPGRPGYYLLQATLNNRADYPQEWPLLELTLTDAGDNPISRRVLPPADWLQPAQQREAFSAHSAIELRIPFAAPALAPTGYRIYAFYP